jgi:hypothetical protein
MSDEEEIEQAQDDLYNIVSITDLAWDKGERPTDPFQLALCNYMMTFPRGTQFTEVELELALLAGDIPGIGVDYETDH